MKNYLSFEDVLIVPKFSHIRSRADVNTKVEFLGLNIFPVISSNMDSVTGPTMAKAMHIYGALGCLHRFWTIEENVKAFLESPKETMASVGLGEKELKRAEALYNAGCERIVIDVAQGASISVVEQVRDLRDTLGNNFYLVVGNFATKQSILDFKRYLGDYKVDAWKIGIGPGSACTTRIVTGCGLPLLGSLLDCKEIEEPLIADGGIKNSGDLSKALAAGASVVFCGKLLAGSEESLSTPIFEPPLISGDLVTSDIVCKYKTYRGSASESSYVVQNKISTHRTPEGESFLVPYTGVVNNTLQQLEAGLRSAMSYIGVDNLIDFRECTELAKITESGNKESGAHGKNA